MNLRYLIGILAFCLSLCLFDGQFAKASDLDPSILKKPYIESIEGDQSVLLIQGNVKRKGKIGSEIEYGEKIKTTEASSASIVYPDGSKIIVAVNSEFRIEPQTDHSQWNRLYQGSVRGIITKVNSSAQKKPRFIIRTKTAVLGVRGTDFVMSMEPGHGVAQIHTMEGIVEVAPNEINLLNGKGISVGEGHAIKGTPSGLGSLQDFNRQEFIKSFNVLPSSPSSSDNGTDTPSSSPEGNSSPAQSNLNETAPPSAAPAAAIPPSIPAVARFPQLELAAKDNKEDPKPQQRINFPKEETSRQIKLLDFQVAGFFARLFDDSTLRAASVAWTPQIPFPFFKFLWLKGYLGGEFAQQGSLNNNFLVYDFQLYLVFTLLNPLFIEGGIGEQIWRGTQRYDAGLMSVNAGLIIKLGCIDRIFIGYQSLNIRPSLNEYKAGIGIQF